MTISQSITEYSTSPVVATPTAATVAGANYLGMGVPEFINYAMAAYLILVIVHKVFQMYKDFKATKDGSNASVK